MSTSDTLRIGSIGEELAQRVLTAAVAATEVSEHRFAIAVVDQAGMLKAFLRQDDAKLNAVQIAQDKAHTAATSHMSTAAWAQALADDAVLAAAAPTAIDRLVAMGGGLPIVVDGEIVGAIGVSGAHWSDDLRIAEDGLAALDRST